jgi:hypothetical protein
MYLVDCFCIHPQWRKKGVADYLLTVLHCFANQHDIPYSLFLKEGPSLSIVLPPLYSGTYAYKCVKKTPIPLTIRTPTPTQAYRIMDVFRACQPDLLVVRTTTHVNQSWRWYREKHHMILACVQDTYQWFMEDGVRKRMGWITAWLESPAIEDECRARISAAIADSFYGEFDYIWANAQWTGNGREWIQDGAFHWYAYQWATVLSIKRSYCILH